MTDEKPIDPAELDSKTPEDECTKEPCCGEPNSCTETPKTEEVKSE